MHGRGLLILLALVPLGGCVVAPVRPPPVYGGVYVAPRPYYAPPPPPVYRPYYGGGWGWRRW